MKRIIQPYQHIVRYYECDRMGITHHSNYVRFMEEARVDWMDQLGYGFDRMEAEGVVSPVMNISCQYKHPTTFKDLITITLTVTEIRGLKISFGYEMRCDGQVVCTAASTHCFLEKGKPVYLRQRFPELYQIIMELIEHD